MREIKYQAWDVKNKRMFQAANMSFRPSGDVFKVWEETIPNTQGLLINPTTGFLREYTGLKDKNSKEIYEGDIVAFLSFQGQVVMDDGSWYMIPLGKEDNVDNIEFLYNYNDEMLEVIGNIYENPELLEAQQ